MHLQGIIKGRYIELPHPIGIPDGMEVALDIQMVRPTYQEQRELIDQLCGAWSKDPSIPAIFDDIAQQRKRSRSRDITFDISS